LVVALGAQLTGDRRSRSAATARTPRARTCGPRRPSSRPTRWGNKPRRPSKARARCSTAVVASSTGPVSTPPIGGVVKQEWLTCVSSGVAKGCTSPPKDWPSTAAGRSMSTTRNRSSTSSRRS
jgi:hypothetical protein